MIEACQMQDGGRRGRKRERGLPGAGGRERERGLPSTKGRKKEMLAWCRRQGEREREREMSWLSKGGTKREREKLAKCKRWGEREKG